MCLSKFKLAFLHIISSNGAVHIYTNGSNKTTLFIVLILNISPSLAQYIHQPISLFGTILLQFV